MLALGLRPGLTKRQITSAPNTGKEKNYRGNRMIESIEKQFSALGQDEYEIVKMRRETGATKNLYQTDIRTIEDMKRKIDSYQVDVERGENLYIRALPDSIHEVIFIDDTHQDAIDFLAQQDILPACVVETSVKNERASLHAWYRLSESVNRATRKAIEYVLIKKQHDKFPDPDIKKMPGDFGSNDGGHLGRLAGSHNFGLTKPKNNAVLLVESTGYVLSQRVTDKLLEEAEKHITTFKKFDADLENIKSHAYDNQKIVQYFKENVIPKMNSACAHFEQDFFAVTYLLKAKFSEADIKKVLLEFDPNPIFERKIGHEAHYLEVTVFNAKQKLETSPPKAPIKTQGGGCGVPLACAASRLSHSLKVSRPLLGVRPKSTPSPKP